MQGNLPDTTVSALAVDTRPSTPAFYAATDLGVYQSLDNGATWTAFGSGLPNVPVVDLHLDSAHSTLYAFSHGRGAWSAIIGSGTSVVSSTLSTVTANPLSVAANGTATATVTVTLLDASSSPIAGKAVSLGQALSAGGTAHSTIIGPTPATTGANGQASFTVSDSSQEVVTYSAAVPSDSVALGATARVLFGTPKLGDVNADGVVNSTDALCVLRLVAGLPATFACPLPLVNPDVDGDADPSPPGADAVDALCILRAVAGLPATAACPAFPAPIAPHDAAAVAVVSAAPEHAGSASASAVSLSSDRLDAGRGRTTTVTVTTTARAAGLGSWTLDIDYDPETATVAACAGESGSICNAGFAAGTIRITGASAAGLGGGQRLAQITFEGSGALRLANVDLTDVQGDAPRLPFPPREGAGG